MSRIEALFPGFIMATLMIESETEVSRGRSLRNRSSVDSAARKPRVEHVAELMPPCQQSMVKHEFHIKTAILIAVVIGAVGALASGKVFRHFSVLPDNHLGTMFWWTALTYGSLMYAVTAWRVILWRRYRPMESVSDQELPSISVIVPAFNEGALVRHSILSVAGSNYPKEKLEIIAVDDGSKDDTWLHIRNAAAQVDSRIKMTTIKQPRNMGKRHALYLGFQQGRGDVFVSIDSDSVIHPDALRNGVSALVRDPRVGAVAGCVEVMNPRQSITTRFLKATFSLSFKFVRAYQNEFRGVFCTPGALSIYRADVVREVAKEWLTQEFLGLPCTTGEDRAMTNLILREGWLTAYQQNSVVYSKMPHTYMGMVRMLLRWGRSNIRETIFLFRFMFTRFRSEYLKTFRFNMVLTAITLFLPPLMIFNSSLLLVTSSGYVLHQLGMILIYAATMSIIYYINERDSDWIWLFVYEFFWVPGLSWIIPYSAFTMRNTGWLTRGNGAETMPQPAAAAVRKPLPAGSGILEPAMAIAQ
jgi:hyaluronan synthase